MLAIVQIAGQQFIVLPTIMPIQMARILQLKRTWTYSHTHNPFPSIHHGQSRHRLSAAERPHHCSPGVVDKTSASGHCLILPPPHEAGTGCIIAHHGVIQVTNDKAGGLFNQLQLPRAEPIATRLPYAVVTTCR